MRVECVCGWERGRGAKEAMGGFRRRPSAGGEENTRQASGRLPSHQSCSSSSHPVNNKLTVTCYLSCLGYIHVHYTFETSNRASHMKKVLITRARWRYCPLGVIKPICRLAAGKRKQGKRCRGLKHRKFQKKESERQSPVEIENSQTLGVDSGGR